ncbi:hypothetical protein ACQ4PT_042259 [Festuca glaucescens]
MARCSRALLPLLLLACALVQSSYAWRSPPGEPQKPEVLPPLEPRGGDDGTPSTEQGANGHRGADGDGAAATSAMGGAGAGPEQTDGRAVVQQVLRTVASPKLARRVLQGGVAADSAAGSSCRSHDARVTCPPPALH